LEADPCIYVIMIEIYNNGTIPTHYQMVAPVFFQIFGIDYTDTYSPVAKFVSICIFLAISVQLGLIVNSMEVDTAFLNADIDEDIWVENPQGTKVAANDGGIYKLKNPYTD
jgi:Reverse transcriptase (RNA-dependent DNA polymerase)